MTYQKSVFLFVNEHTFLNSQSEWWYVSIKYKQYSDFCSVICQYKLISNNYRFDITHLQFTPFDNRLVFVLRILIPLEPPTANNCKSSRALHSFALFRAIIPVSFASPLTRRPCRLIIVIIIIVIICLRFYAFAGRSVTKRTRTKVILCLLLTKSRTCSRRWRPNGIKRSPTLNCATIYCCKSKWVELKDAGINYGYQ